MANEVKFTNYSYDDKYIIKVNGENHSTIVTKMIQLAGRICEQYASDIVYDANDFIEAVKNKKDFDIYLFFREWGVTSLKPENVGCIDNGYIQVWHLTYNAKTMEQKLTRVNVF